MARSLHLAPYYVNKMEKQNYSISAGSGRYKLPENPWQVLELPLGKNTLVRLLLIFGL